jgi:glutamyl-tRNA synthetase
MRVLERRLQPSQTESSWSISTGEEVTLMDWGNAIVKEIKTENGMITQLIGELHLEGSVKSTKLKLTWLPGSADW